jgi:hypothetical protein
MDSLRQVQQTMAQMESSQLTPEQETLLWETLDQETQQLSPSQLREVLAPVTPAPVTPAPQTKTRRGRPRGSKNNTTDSGMPQENNIPDIKIPGSIKSVKSKLETPSIESTPPEIVKDEIARGSHPTKLEKNITNLYYSLGVSVSWINLQDGLTIADQAEARAHEVAIYAQHHPAFKQWLEHFIEKSDLYMLLAGHAQLTSTILANHHIVPQDIGHAIKTEVKARLNARLDKQRAKQNAASTAASNGAQPYPFGPLPRTRE